MTAELKLTFQNLPKNIVPIIQSGFQNQNVGLQEIIEHTIYRHRDKYHSCFFHGFHAIDATLLFQIAGNELLVHIEVPQSNNMFVSLSKKVNSYYRNIAGLLKNEHVNTKKIGIEVIITSEDSYILVGKLPNKHKDFLKQLDKDKFRLIITPIVLILLNLSAKHWGIIQNIESAVIGAISVILGLIVWYMFDFFKLSKASAFKFEPINE